MKRNFRNAFNALKKIGVPVKEYHGEEPNFWISAEEDTSNLWADYFDGYRIRLGVRRKPPDHRDPTQIWVIRRMAEPSTINCMG
jgi:hypothetical protein